MFILLKKKLGDINITWSQLREYLLILLIFQITQGMLKIRLWRLVGIWFLSQFMQQS